MVFICLHFTLKQNHSCAICQEDKEEHAYVYSALDYCLFNSMNSWLILNRELDICSFIFADTLLEYWPLQVVHSSSLCCWWPWITFISFTSQMQCVLQRDFPFKWGWHHQRKKKKIVKSYLKLVVLTFTLSLVSSIFCVSKLFRATAILQITHFRQSIKLQCILQFQSVHEVDF